MKPDEQTGWAMASLGDARKALDDFAADHGSVARIEIVASLLVECFESGGKVLVCGNGGSCADAMHFAEELTGRFRAERPALAALACADPGHLTCVANDYGFDQIFARWVEALGRSGDVLIVLSTSGKSRNIVKAVAQAKQSNVRTVALLGKGGDTLAGECDFEWIVPGAQSDRIQEIHMLVLHALVEGVERIMFPDSYR